MKKYRFSLLNLVVNTLKLFTLWVRKPDEISDFIDQQVEFQSATGPFDKPLPKENSDWKVKWWQNAAINFETDDIYTSASQIELQNNQLVSLNNEGIHIRLAAMFNDIKLHGAKKTYSVDTIDAAYSKTAFPVFSYNRLASSETRFLWPLKGFHSLGDHRFLSLLHRDTKPFLDKEAKIFWSGKLNGQIEHHGEQLTLVACIKKLIEKSSEFSDHDLELLRKFPRFLLLDKFKEDPLFDVRLSPRDKEDYTTHPHLKGWFKGFVPFEYQKNFRYLLAIGGSDLATNFYRSLDTNSVVLKVETPWQGFLDGHFLPWEHYVPIKSDLSDLREKYEWCEANIAECQKISQAAQKVTLLCKSRFIRRACLKRVVQDYEQRFWNE